MRSYLVEAYLSSTGSLYGNTLFRIIRERIGPAQSSCGILDLGCADRRAKNLLGSGHKYFGVDIDPGFNPDLIADIRDLETCLRAPAFEVDTILLTDVLEHLDRGTEDIDELLKKLNSLVSPSTRIFIVVPQLYRLDALKLPHLHYPEHKVRFTSREWAELITRYLDVKDVTGISYLSVMPYLLMFSKKYKDGNTLGSLFKQARRKLSGNLAEQIDYGLTARLGRSKKFKHLSNSVLYECRVRR